MRDKDTSSSLVKMTYTEYMVSLQSVKVKNVNPASVNCDPVTSLRYVIQLIWEGVKNGIFRTLSSIGGRVCFWP